MTLWQKCPNSSHSSNSFLIRISSFLKRHWLAFQTDRVQQSNALLLARSFILFCHHMVCNLPAINIPSPDVFSCYLISDIWESPQFRMRAMRAPTQQSTLVDCSCQNTAHRHLPSKNWRLVHQASSRAEFTGQSRNVWNLTISCSRHQHSTQLCSTSLWPNAVI